MNYKPFFIVKMSAEIIVGNRNQIRRMFLIFENIGADKASKTCWEFRTFISKVGLDSDGEYNILVLHLYDMDNKMLKVEIYRDGSYKYIY
jgi:hypothetical protein